MASLRDVPPEAAAALLGAALPALGLPAAVSAAVVAVAPKLLPLLADLLERHAAGEPLPDILRATLPDNNELVDQLLAAKLGEGRSP